MQCSEQLLQINSIKKSSKFTKTLNNDNDPHLSECQVSHMTSSIVNYFVKGQFDDKTLHVGFTSSIEHGHHAHTDECFTNVSRVLRNKNRTSIKVKDIHLKYGR